jgi:hypothetical protein
MSKYIEKYSDVTGQAEADERIPNETALYSNKALYFKRHFINIDSRQRSINKYPNSNNFVIDLVDKYYNVIYCKLLTAEVPNTDFNINEYNNRITLVDNGVTYNLALPIGDYDDARLLTELATLFNTSGASNTYTFTLVDQRLRISATGGVLPFQLLFATGPYSDRIADAGYGTTMVVRGTDARIVMGFNIEDYTSGPGDPSILLSPNKIDINCPSYIMLDLGRDFMKVEAIDGVTRDKFYKIQLDVPCNDRVFLTENKAEKRVKVFDPPIPVVNKLNVKYYTYYGPLFNFRGYENSFTLEIGTLVNQK